MEERVASDRFTGADKVQRNLKFTTFASVPCILLLLFLIVIKGMTEAWIGLAIMGIMWALIFWRFKGVGVRGLPPQK
jgi:hypothetical protein